MVMSMSLFDNISLLATTWLLVVLQLVANSTALECHICLNCTYVDNRQLHTCKTMSMIYRISLCATHPQRYRAYTKVLAGTDYCYKEVLPSGVVNRGCASREWCQQRIEGFNLFTFDYPREKNFQCNNPERHRAKVCCCRDYGCNHGTTITLTQQGTLRHITAIVMILLLSGQYG